jgi:hypothetical protein
MHIIDTISEGLDDLPLREVWYFGPKMVKCSKKEIICHGNYLFERLTYEIKGNGILILKMFNGERNDIFSTINICLIYEKGGYFIKFFNNENPGSNKYFEFKAHTDFTFEKILNKLVLIAEKKRLFKSPDLYWWQYVYAYIIYVFFPVNEKQIPAHEFSERYMALKKMKDCYASKLTDDLAWNGFSSDTVIYKVFDRFRNKQLAAFKSKPIVYNW